MESTATTPRRKRQAARQSHGGTKAATAGQPAQHEEGAVEASSQPGTDTEFKATMVALAKRLGADPGTVTFGVAPEDPPEGIDALPPEGWADLPSFLEHCAATGWGQDFQEWSAKNKPASTGAVKMKLVGRTRREELEKLLAFAHVIGASPSELRFDNFVTVHGRNPGKEEGKALDLADEEPFPPYHECNPDLYLEVVADWLRTHLDINRLPAPRPIERFKEKLEAATKRSGNGKLRAKDLLLCALEALGVDSSTAHRLLKRIPNEEAELARRKHLGDFVSECCYLSWGKVESRFCKVTSAALYSTYRKWCLDNPTKLDGQKTYTTRKFSTEILKCGGVTEWRTARQRGFLGIAPR